MEWPISKPLKQLPQNPNRKLLVISAPDSCNLEFIRTAIFECNLKHVFINIMFLQEKDPQDKNGSPANVKANVHVLLAEPDSGEHSDNNTIENGFKLATAQDVEPNGKLNGNGITQETTDSV